MVDELGTRYGAPRARRDREIREALSNGVLQIDQVFQAPAAADEMRYLGALLRQADRYCTNNRLLTLERPRLVQQFSGAALTLPEPFTPGDPTKVRWTMSGPT